MDATPLPGLDMLRTADLEYELPPGAIATRPVRPRDAARLLVVGEYGDRPAEHRHVRDLDAILRAGDVLVVNSTRVLPARLEGRREDSGGRVEGLFLGVLGSDGAEGLRWAVMLRMRRHTPGARIRLHDAPGRATDVVLEILGPSPEEPGTWVVRVHAPDVGVHGADATSAILERVGSTPLPPYIASVRRHADERVEDATDRESYQTVYAAQPGSVAAPTAGLHFTRALLERLTDAGVGVAHVVLHVGTGTFRPVETATVEAHPMHAERCEVSPATAAMVLGARAAGGRVVAVGSTSARTLESFTPGELERLAGGTAPESRWTSLLIAPGHRWAHVDGLLTNFHLPRSTLLALVAARLRAGVPRLMALYHEAIREGYRFYSYGDAMLVLP